MIANAGLVGIPHRGFGTQRRPAGGMRAVLGTNPIAFRPPVIARTLVSIWGTSASWEPIWHTASVSESSCPKGSPIDADGHPTRDPRRRAAVPTALWRIKDLASL